MLLVLCAVSNVGWSQCIRGDCENGQGLFSDANRRYEEGFRNGKFHGKEAFDFLALGKNQGDLVIGEFRNDTLSGRGHYFWADGRRV